MHLSSCPGWSTCTYGRRGFRDRLGAWQAGPLGDAEGPVFVSLTDFRYRTAKDLREATTVGLELRRTWPVLHGAVGLWLWSAPAAVRGGWVSVWRDAEDLRRFVRWPVHLAIMRAWCDRGSVVSHGWTGERFDPLAIRDQARRALELAGG